MFTWWSRYRHEISLFFWHKQKKLKPHNWEIILFWKWLMQIVFIFLTWFAPETWLKKSVCLLKKASRLFKIFWIHKYAKNSRCSVATTKFYLIIFHSVCALDSVSTCWIWPENCWHSHPFLFKIEQRARTPFYVSVTATTKVFDVKENHFAEI